MGRGGSGYTKVRTVQNLQPANIVHAHELWNVAFTEISTLGSLLYEMIGLRAYGLVGLRAFIIQVFDFWVPAVMSASSHQRVWKALKNQIASAVVVSQRYNLHTEGHSIKSSAESTEV